MVKNCLLFEILISFGYDLFFKICITIFPTPAPSEVGDDSGAICAAGRRLSSPSHSHANSARVLAFLFLFDFTKMMSYMFKSE